MVMLIGWVLISVETFHNEDVGVFLSFWWRLIEGILLKYLNLCFCICENLYTNFATNCMR